MICFATFLKLNGKGLRVLILSLALVQTCFLLVMYSTELLPDSINIVNVESIKIYWTGGGELDNEDGDIVKLREQYMEDFFVDIAHLSCFKAGSDKEKSLLVKRCVCIGQYSGEDCGIPQEVKSGVVGGELVDVGSFTQRERPRRIIAALPVNHELDLFEARINMHYDVVDIFIVQESNFTNSGKSKPLFFKDKLSTGWLSKFQDKILYILRNDHPPSGFINGKAADADMRRHLSVEGLKMLTDVRLDDLFIYTDSDEITKPEILTFLKLYDGIPHIISFSYIWSIYGFFWQVDSNVHGLAKTFEKAAVTIQFFRDFYNYDASHIRTDDYKDPKMDHSKMLGKYSARNESVGPLNIGRAGWHCSWCFKPEGIRRKLLDAPNSDFPRYGDYPGKTETKYIERLIKHGLYFDMRPLRNDSGVDERTDPEFAPPYVQKNRGQFQYLLVNPYENVDLPKV